MHASQHDHESPLVALRFELGVAGLEAGRQEREDESGTGDIQISKIGAVRFMEVVVGLEEGGARANGVSREEGMD